MRFPFSWNRRGDAPSHPAVSVRRRTGPEVYGIQARSHEGKPGARHDILRYQEMVQVLFQKLRRDRIFCGMIHGDMEQKERLKNVDAFRRGGFRYLIATDVAARGIDFEDVGLVVNYDFPMGRETYVHRIGRTGRNGKAGRSGQPGD